MCLTLGVYYIIIYYYILYIIHILLYYSYYILSYTILFFSSSSLPSPYLYSIFPSFSSYFLLSPHHPNHLHLPSIFSFISSHSKYTCRHFLTVIYIILQQSFPDNLSINSFYTYRYLYNLIYIPDSSKTDPACFIGVDG